MHLHLEQNRANIRLDPGESFYTKASLLRGFSNFDWTIPPRFSWGSPILRIYHGTWILKKVTAPAAQALDFTLYGTHARGNFLTLTLGKQESYVVAGRCLAGFSQEITGIQTKIRFSPSFLLLREHFFSVIRGPGTVLLYSPSSLEETQAVETTTERWAAFRSDKRFRPISPQPKTVASKIINVFFSREVIWQFEESGGLIVESAAHGEEKPREGFLKRTFKHLLGFLRI